MCNIKKEQENFEKTIEKFTVIEQLINMYNIENSLESKRIEIDGLLLSCDNTRVLIHCWFSAITLNARLRSVKNPQDEEYNLHEYKEYLGAVLNGFLLSENRIQDTISEKGTEKKGKPPSYLVPLSISPSNIFVQVILEWYSSRDRELVKSLKLIAKWVEDMGKAHPGKTFYYCIIPEKLITMKIYYSLLEADIDWIKSEIQNPPKKS